MSIGVQNAGISTFLFFVIQHKTVFYKKSADNLRTKITAGFLFKGGASRGQNPAPGGYWDDVGGPQ